jgi:Ni/Co efflux regulator RcnB
MRSKRWLCLCTALLFALSGLALADEHGHGHGKHQDRDDDDRDRGKHYYSNHDRDEMRGWYHDHDDHLPPGLAKRDRLPPGLERQLRVRGTLPPGLRREIRTCPEELERRLPPPPLGYAHVAIGGHIVLVNRSTYMVLDIFHFER